MMILGLGGPRKIFKDCPECGEPLILFSVIGREFEKCEICFYRKRIDDDYKK